MLSSEVRSSARSLIAGRLGLDFPEERDDDLERRLVRAARAAGEPDTARYVARLGTLAADGAEWRRLASHLTVGETYFFRDQPLFEALERHVLPPLLARRRREGTRRLRLWSAGCSSGEEPYSLAMLVDRLLPDRSDWSVTILATDLNTRTLSVAEAGLYREWSFRNTPEPIRRRYFASRGHGAFELAPAIRRMVTFAPLNLAEEVYPSATTNTSAMDLILCRNVIMYFTREAQRATVARLQSALLTGGWLALSPAEASAELLRPLAPVSFPGAVLFQKSSAPSAPPPHVQRRDSASRGSPARRPPARRLTPNPPREPRQPPAEASPLALARAEAGLGNLERARELCRKAVGRDRLDSEAHLLLAAIQQELGNVPAAIDAVRSAIYLAPDSPSAHFTLGSLLLRQGKRDMGRRSMETVVGLLSSVPADEVVDGADGLLAGRLLETASAYLEAP